MAFATCVGLIGVGADSQRAVTLSDQLHQLSCSVDTSDSCSGFSVLPISTCMSSLAAVLICAGKDLAGGAVDADRIAFLAHLTATPVSVSFVVVDLQVAGAADADLAHLAGDQRRVASYAAASGENALGGDHAAEIFGAGFEAGEHDLLALGRSSSAVARR